MRRYGVLSVTRGRTVKIEVFEGWEAKGVTV